jgi:hypothetical protein
MPENEKIEIYKGELVLACHQITQQFAKKHGLQYSSLPYLEGMASLLAEALQQCNPEREVVVHDAMCSPEEMERSKAKRKKVSDAGAKVHLMYPLTRNGAFKFIEDSDIKREPVDTTGDHAHDLREIPEWEGLYECVVCTAVEGELPKSCPGRKMDRVEKLDVLERRRDFYDGAWHNTASDT